MNPAELLLSDYLSFKKLEVSRAINHNLERNDRVRVRANGLLVEDDRLLMVQLDSPLKKNPIWMPPGGGVRFGEPLQKAVEREMLEETGVKVSVGSLWYLHEVFSSDIHAVELYYMCTRCGGQLVTGKDPELADNNQIILDVDFFPLTKLNRDDVEPKYLRMNFVSDYRSTDVHHPKVI